MSYSAPCSEFDSVAGPNWDGFTGKPQTGQMSIPNSLTKKFSAKCIDVKDGDDTLPPGAKEFPVCIYYTFLDTESSHNVVSGLLSHG